MLTTNYYKMKGFYDSHTNTFDGSAYGVPAADIVVTDIDGNNISNLSYCSNNNASYATYAASNYSLKLKLYTILGSDDTTPTISDYNIGTPISISNLTTTMTTTGENDKVSTKFIITGTNTTGSSVTIKEIGIVKKVSVLSASYPTPQDPNDDNYNKKILLDHTLLETPITVAANDNFSLTFEWTEQ